MKVFAFFLVVLSSVSQADQGKIRIVSVEEIRPRIHEVTLIEARPKTDYLKSHSARSLHMDWKDWVEESPTAWNAFFGNSAKWGKVLSDILSLEARLSDMGLSHEVTILVLGNPREWGEEGRIAWNLLYWGAKEVWLLDGGFPAWKDAGLPIEVGSPSKRTKSNFRVQLRPERRALLAEVKTVQATEQGMGRLLDARNEEEFHGKKVTGQKRGGHIPGAQLVPVLKLYESDGKYLPAESLKKMLQPAESLKKMSPPFGEKKNHSNPFALERPISYCTGGVRSALLAMLIEARLGIMAANFDGSLWEWSADRSLPLSP